MRVYKYLSLVGLVISANSVFSQPMEFPLQVGNRWEFDQASAFFANCRITGDTLMPNTHQYAVFETNPKYNWPLDFTYVRQSGDTVYHYNPESRSEEVLYRFDANPGDTVLKVPKSYFGAPQDTFVIIFNFRQTDTVFGARRRQWFFSLFPLMVADAGQSRTITDSLGLTTVGEATGDSNLKGAVINGRSYGNITSTDSRSLFPKSAVLYQNFPNPFNPKTTISFDLPTDAQVNLEVYDLLGRKIVTLYDGRLHAGSHTVEFKGNSLASGVYMCRLSTRSGTMTRKLILAK